MSDSNNPSRAKIIIDRLVLRGIDPHHAEALADSLKQQLAVTLSDPAQRHELLRASTTPVLRLGRIPLASGRAGALDFGAKVARAIGTQVSSLRSSGKGATR
jgi:hypothetical protein